MLSQHVRTLVLLCVIIALVGSPGLVSGYAAEDREILEHIAVQTRHDERLEGTEVHIVVRGGQIVLSGTVYLYSQKILYEHIVEQTPGVAEITNDVRVVPRLPVEDVEIARRIRALIKDHQRFQNTDITVDVAQGAVSLSGTFHDPGDFLFLQYQVAEIEGVIRLEISALFVT
ncbi:MAG TPA: BON domain-containing protein [Candidatus Tectomicrobia bacterium]